MTKVAKTFIKNYEILEDIYKDLQNNEVDVDQMLEMLKKAATAHKACKSRIDAVNKALSEYLENE